MRQGRVVEELAKYFNKTTKKISEIMPKSVRDAEKDLEKTVHTILQSAFAKLDLVTRKEFDTQAGVLAKTRKKLEALEKQVAAFERQQGKVEKKAK